MPEDLKERITNICKEYDLLMGSRGNDGMAEAPLTTGGSEAEGGAEASLQHRPGIEAADIELLREAGKQEMGGVGADVLC